MTNSMRALGVASALVLAAAAAIGPARADPMTAADILSNFNLVTTGNVSTQSDIVGDAVVGGDLSGATFFGGGPNVPASPTLYVFGKLNSSLNLNSGGSLYDAGIDDPACQLQRRRQALHHAAQSARLLHRSADRSFGAARQPDRDSGTSFVNGKFNAGSNTGVVVFEITGVDARARPREPRHQLRRQWRHVLHHQRHWRLHRSEQHAFQRRSAGCAVQFRGCDHGQSRAVGRFDPCA